MCDWQKGIGQLDPNAKVNFSFRNGFSSSCDNIQLFKALGIYDKLERDVLSGFENAKVKYWGIPIDTEDHGYYNRSQRPVVSVISEVETDDSDMGKTIVLKNEGEKPITLKVKTSKSTTEYEETIIDLSTSVELNQNTEITVESESSKFSATFSAKTNRKVTENYSLETETSFTISTGEQLVKVKNPTQITKFKVRINGKFCINCAPSYNGHYLWMPQLNNVYECEIFAEDIGITSWWIEKISDQAINTQSKLVGAE